MPDYEVFAIRYAHVSRQRHENFMTADDHDGPMPMDYFVWVIRNKERVILVDTGFNSEAAAQRGRQFLRCPIQALEVLGLNADDVQDVVITHMHYDHAGNTVLLPNARFHLQEAEMQYATGRYMRYAPLRHPFNVGDVTELVKRLFDDQVVYHNGDAWLAEGIELILVGGHTQGLQAVRVHTARGWVVLASDASHYYDNFRNYSPFPVVLNVGDMLQGYDKLLSLASSKDHLIPGHDPLVRDCYLPWGKPENDVIALHLPPRQTLVSLTHNR
tara:strand:+ start:12814 stop:13629 length:816 start_codon:yes stop_codon:yes gene_type:complete